mgnify:CR=1 FL=1
MPLRRHDLTVRPDPAGLRLNRRTVTRPLDSADDDAVLLAKPRSNHAQAIDHLDHALDRADALGDLLGGVFQLLGIVAEQLDFDRLRHRGQITDQILHQLRGLDLQARHFGRDRTIYNPWHYVPVLTRKPGALRNGAPFHDWVLPAAMEKVRADKLREVKAGHDGTWVAHPGMVALATEVFDRIMPTPNQIDSGKQQDITITAADLLTPPDDSITEGGVRTNINVGIQYLAAWLRGSGAVPIHNLMEDAATAEISRAQLWQWLHNGAKLEDGRVLDQPLFDELFNDESAKLGPDYADAARLFKRTATETPLMDFLTLPGYEQLA